jgi:hypothetical protein
VLSEEARELSRNLRAQCYTVNVVVDVQMALASSRSGPCDLILISFTYLSPEKSTLFHGWW